MRTLIQGGSLLTPQELLPDYDVLIEDGQIAAILQARHYEISRDDLETIDARGLLVIPGLIDLHIHGSAGSDTMDASPDALHTMAAFIVRHGVTSYLPTTLTGPSAHIHAAVENICQAPQPEAGARHLGAHLEGPYLVQEYGGAQPPEWLRQPDVDEVERWIAMGCVRLITLAPELPGALEMIDRCARKGIRCSVGHSAASYEQVVSAADHGLTQATHTFNGMQGLNHRQPGTLGAILSDDRIFAEIIADGVHVHPAVVKLAVRAKGVEKIILVTDAIRAAGLDDGDYTLGGQVIQVKDGVARTARGGLAGSTLTLDRAVRNVMAYTGVSIQDAVSMATTNPARALGLLPHKGVLQPGADADLALVDPDFNVLATMVGGRLVYDARNENDEQSIT